MSLSALHRRRLELGGPRVNFAGPEPLIEALTWHDAAVKKPDTDVNVLLWLAAGDDTVAGWTEGWWDGEDWRLAESGGVAAEQVLFWAQPEGPAA